MEYIAPDSSRQPSACGQPSLSMEPLTTDLLRRELKALDLGSSHDVREVLHALKELRAEVRDLCLNAKAPVHRPLQSISELQNVAMLPKDFRQDFDGAATRIDCLDELQFVGFRRASIASQDREPHTKSRHDDSKSYRRKFTKLDRSRSEPLPDLCFTESRPPQACHRQSESRSPKACHRPSIGCHSKASHDSASSRRMSFLKVRASQVMSFAFGGNMGWGRTSQHDKSNACEDSRDASFDALPIIPKPPDTQPPQPPGCLPGSTALRGRGSVLFASGSQSDTDSVDDHGDSELPHVEPVVGRTRSSLKSQLRTTVRSTVRSQTAISFVSDQTRSSMDDDDTDSGSHVSSSSRVSGGQRCQRICYSLVTSRYFDHLFGLLVLLNALSIGLQVDISARSQSEQPPDVFRAMECLFFAAFAAEVLLRISAQRIGFFRGPGWSWNVFDSVVVLSQLAEEVIAFIAAHHSSRAALPNNLQSMRTIRLLRIIRLVRVVRILRLVKELQTIVLSVASSMKSLFWTIVLLLVVIFTVAVYFTQLISDQRIAGMNTPEVEEQLTRYYDGLGLSILTLYQAITGGVEWNNVVRPLISEAGPLSGLLFVLYVAFSVLALMNTVTGVFVESALKSAKEHHDTFLLAHVRQLFAKAAGNEGGMVSWEDFQAQLEHTFMHEFFKAIDVEIAEAESLFRLLDVDDCGALDLEQLMDGCLRLQGPARAIDLSLLMHDSRRASRKFLSHLGIIEYQLKELSERIPKSMERTLARDQASE